ERRVPEDAVFDPRMGSYRARGSSFVPEGQGLRERLGLDPERNFKSNLERITDYVVEKGETAGSIADLKKDPLLRQLDDSGPVLDALHTAKKYADQQGLGDLEVRGLLDDVLLASMGSTQATARVQKFSAKLYADMIDIEKSLGESRKSVMSSPYIPFKDKLDAFETDPAVKVQIEAVADEMREAATKLSRLQNQAAGKGLRAHNAVGRGVYAAPGAIRKGIDAGFTAAYKTFRPNGPGGPRIHLMNGIRLPHTLDFASLNVAEEFNQRVDEAIATLRKERLETPDGRFDVDDETLETLTRFKDEFAKTEDPIGRRDADALAARRRALFEDFQVATRDAMVHKLTAKVAAKEAKAGNAVNIANIRSEVEVWMREYEKQSKAVVQGFHRKRNDKDPAHVAREYVARSDQDFAVLHPGLAQALDKRAATTAHRFRFAAFEDFFSKTSELGRVFNDVDPEGVGIKTVASEFFDEINDHLKWLLLGRTVAYTLRNALESSQRVLATQDVLTAFASVGRGLLNAGSNLRRVTTDQIHLAEAQMNHSILERRLMEERMDLQNVYDTHLAIADSLKRKKKSSGAEYNRAAEIKLRMDLLDEQIERSRQITNMSPDEWREYVKQRATMGLAKQIEE